MTAAVLLLRVKCIWSASHTTAHKANNTRSFTLSSYASRHAYPKTGRNLPAAVPCQSRVEAFACSAQRQSTRFASLRPPHSSQAEQSQQSTHAKTFVVCCRPSAAGLFVCPAGLCDARKQSLPLHAPLELQHHTTSIRLASTRLKCPPLPTIHPPHTDPCGSLLCPSRRWWRPSPAAPGLVLKVRS